MTWWQTTLWAFGGGVSIQFYYLWARSNMPANRRVPLNKTYWIVGFVALPLVGAFLVSAYQQSGNEANPIIATYVGLATPALLRSMAKDNPFESAVDPPPGA